MYPLLPVAHSALVLVGTLALGAAVTTLYDRSLWRARSFQLGVTGFAATAGTGVLLWRFGSAAAASWGVTLVWSALPVAATVIAGASVVVALRLVVHALQQVRGDRGAKSARAGARRDFLRRAAAVVPLGAGVVGAMSMAGDDPPCLRRIPLKFAELPPDLQGLSILQLSDLHLGAGPSSADLKALLDGLRADPPDLVVLTGDVADKVEELEAALELVTQFAPRLGVYAALGNHEYLNDIERMLPVYQRSPLKLLINQTAQLRIGETTLFISGVDDPVFHDAPRHFYEQAVADCAAGAVGAGFRLLLCHRPEGFEAAARHGFDLTLSGHTHGAQLGLLGRSAIEVLFGIPYQWGLYRRGRSRLYTTSGFGQWFPFRLNCPAEAPLIVLEREER
jgi:predicted MPP superfamily phosphohydrolase